ncbi:purine-cytosine permease family protein [Streptomyces indicus]|uniref:Cytosine permease n=1 Tax=Streptomyces indicus TaxID=417292 RepID=A0A1G9A8H6_9ACTN|nr:cytosine permease [Streptomyces indicus]SDK23583.1 cytosine permease [Streptomyces indicus]
MDSDSPRTQPPPDDKSAATRARRAAEATEDFAADRLPPDERRSTLSITLVRMGFTVSATDLLYGMSLGLFFPFWTGVLIAVGSSLVVSVVSILCGLIGQRERITTALGLKAAFGRGGSRLPSLVIALLSAGFVGYSTGITAGVLPGGKDPWIGLVYCVVLSALYTALSIVGFGKGLTWVGRISVPLMLVTVVIAVAAAVDHAGGIGEIVGAEPARAGEATALALFALGVNKWMTGATVTPDITRFGKSKSTVYTTTVAEFMVGNFGFNMLGILLGLGVREADMGEAFGIVGVGALATFAIFVQGFPHEVNNMYAASLAGRTAVDLPRIAVNVIAGVLACGLAYYGLTAGILDAFLTYLGYLGYAIPLIPGILVADYFLLRRGRYDLSEAAVAAVNWRAVWAYFAGLGINLVLGFGFDDKLWHTLPLTGAILYLLFSLPQWRAARAARMTVAEPVTEAAR